MVDKPLTVSEVLRFANHDFLNQLHLIQMYLDLQLVDEAKVVIQNVSEQCNMLSNVNRLGLPKTVEWLQTLIWRYPALQVKLTSNVVSQADPMLDDHIVQYLENTVIHVYTALDPFTEQELDITVECNADAFLLAFHLKGQWDAPRFNKEMKQLAVQTIEETTSSWHFILSTLKE